MDAASNLDAIRDARPYIGATVREAPDAHTATLVSGIVYWIVTLALVKPAGKGGY